MSKIRFPQDLARFSLSYASGEKPPGPAVVVIKSYPPLVTHSTLDKDADAKREAPVAQMQNRGSGDSAELGQTQYYIFISRIYADTAARLPVPA
jgi:hypothetical protein